MLRVGQERLPRVALDMLQRLEIPIQFSNPGRRERVRGRPSRHCGHWPRKRDSDEQTFAPDSPLRLRLIATIWITDRRGSVSAPSARDVFITDVAAGRASTTSEFTARAVIEEDSCLLTGFGRRLFASLYEELCGVEERIAALEKHLERIFQQSDRCRRLAEVEGVGPVVATAVIAAIADGRSFHNGRQFAAWVGLVPRQHSSGEKQRLSGITKRGDPYLRMLLIHGARSVVYRSPHKADTRSQWIAEKQRRLGTSKACVALANKNARIIWALLAHDEPYRRAA
jgi:transposase